MTKKIEESKPDTLAFIPARGGSKGILNKNIVELCGKPLIHYTLAIAQQLGSKVLPFISTDSDLIGDYCDSQGFPTRYRRPANLSGDRSSVIDAILDALDWLKLHNEYYPKQVLMLQPTSPVRRIEDVEQAITLFNQFKTDSMVSVTKMREHPFECVERASSGSWKFLREPGPNVIGRQMYPDVFFFIDGSFYLCTVDFIRRERALVKPDETRLFEIDQRWSLDIDEHDDLEVASALLSGKSEGG